MEFLSHTDNSDESDQSSNIGFDILASIDFGDLVDLGFSLFLYISLDLIFLVSAANIHIVHIDGNNNFQHIDNSINQLTSICDNTLQPSV